MLQPLQIIHLKWGSLNISFVSSKNERDLQTTTECLIKEQARLEGGDEWEPR